MIRGHFPDILNGIGSVGTLFMGMSLPVNDFIGFIINDIALTAVDDLEILRLLLLLGCLEILLVLKIMQCNRE